MEKLQSLEVSVIRRYGRISLSVFTNGKSDVTISIGRNGKTAITGSFRKSLKNEHKFLKHLNTKSASMISLMEKLPSLEGKIAITGSLEERPHECD